MKYIFLLLFSSNIWALCTCERESLELGLNQAKHIFEAKVIHIQNHEMSVEVLKTYKGNAYNKIELGQKDCAPQFQPNEIYVFYLNESRVETECNRFFRVKDKNLYQNFLKFFVK